MLCNADSVRIRETSKEQSHQNFAYEKSCKGSVYFEKNQKFLSGICLCLTTMLLLCACDVNQIKNKIANTEEKSVDTPDIQEQTKEDIKEVRFYGSDYTLGQLIDAGIGSPTYESYQSKEDGRTYVKITGNMVYDGVSVVAVLKYVWLGMSSDGSLSYDFHSLTFNDVPQNDLAIDQFFAFLEECAVKKYGAVLSSKSTETYSQDMATSEYVLPDSDMRYLEWEEVEALANYGGKDLIRLAVNEMYARHGFVFKKPKNQEYFERKSWYYPQPGLTDSYVKEHLFNDYEKANLEMLLKVEKRFN
ncbi:YARHG domain-containing protein [Filifactor alocis]|uniref:YARHG domain-containing protein n=1 Tax=Filifactor alocis TaxID=143361 RepID=UPI0028E8DB15|nr:YARHG domain-containing protein [Filifactor alocis]